MPAIDGLLKLVDAQNAEGLVLNTGKPPALVKGGMPSALSMPPLSRNMVEVFLREVLTPEQNAAFLTGEVVDAHYRSERLGAFSVRVRASGEKWVVTFRATTASASTLTARQEEELPDAVLERPREGQGESSGGRVEPRAVAAVSSRGASSLPASAAEGLRIGDVGFLPELLEQAVARGASDVLLSCGSRAAFRILGEWQEQPGVVPTEEMVWGLVAPSLTPARREELDATGSLDVALAVSLPGGLTRRFRINVFRQQLGLGVAIRPVLEEVLSLERLNLPEQLRSLVDFPYGLVLVTGAAGSGKSTTLASLLEHLNRTKARHVITLEDPIEYIYPRRKSLIHQREVGTHVDSFASGLRAALREAPDVILLGEMRDRETIAAALTAAETGHLVLGTLHAGTAAMAVDRIVDVFSEGQQAQIRVQLASTLRAVVTQRLLPGAQPGQRVPALEILQVNAAAAALIRERKGHQLPTIIQSGREDGMLSLERSLIELVRNGRLTREVALRTAPDPGQLQELGRVNGGGRLERASSS